MARAASSERASSMLRRRGTAAAAPVAVRIRFALISGSIRTR